MFIFYCHVWATVLHLYMIPSLGSWKMSFTWALYITLPYNTSFLILFGQVSRLAPVHPAVSLCPDRSPAAQTCPFLLRIWRQTRRRLWEVGGRENRVGSLSGASERGQSGPPGALWLNWGHQRLSSSPFQLISSAGERSRVLQKKKRERTRVKKGNRWPPPVEAVFEIADPLVDTLSDICVSSMQ